MNWISVVELSPSRSGRYRVRSRAGVECWAYFSHDTEPHWIKEFWGDPVYWSETK